MSKDTLEKPYSQETEVSDATMVSRLKKIAGSALSRTPETETLSEVASPTVPTSEELLAQIPEDIPPYRQLAIAAEFHDQLADTLHDTSTIDPIIDTLSHRAFEDFKEWEHELSLKPHDRTKDKLNPPGLSIKGVMGCIHAWEAHQTEETKQTVLKAIKLAGGTWSTRFDTAFHKLMEEKKTNKESSMTFIDALKLVNLDYDNGESTYEGLYDPNVPFEVTHESLR